MDRNDQQAIGYLFEKLANVEQQAPPRDPEAEALIRDQIGRQPGAPYYMAQTIVVQEQALEAAQARIEELERSASRPPAGGLFGGLFGGGSLARSGSAPRAGRSGGGGAAQLAFPQTQQPRGGGGFLAGAAQTAMGVAGGVLLANAIGGMFGAGDAEAGEPDAGADDDGGDFGDAEF